MIDAAAVMLLVDGRLPWYGTAVILAAGRRAGRGYKLVVPRGYDFEVSSLGKLATWVLYASLGVPDRHGQRHRLAALALLDRRRAGARRRGAVRVKARREVHR